jgi:hypothetical protein
MERVTVTPCTRRWLRFLSPGSFVANERDVDVEATFDPATSRVDWPQSAYAFDVFEQQSVVVGGKEFKSAAVRVGKQYWHHDSRIYAVEDLEAMKAASPILLSNCRCNGWKHVIFSRFGNWPQPYESKDIELLTERS